jgi:hypothetical protein
LLPETHNNGDHFVPSIVTATVASNQIETSSVKPLRGAEGALDVMICLEKRLAVTIDGFFPIAFLTLGSRMRGNERHTVNIETQDDALFRNAESAAASLLPAAKSSAKRS